jgi:hypothetical protein
MELAAHLSPGHRHKHRRSQTHQLNSSNQHQTHKLVAPFVSLVELVLSSVLKYFLLVG